MIEIGDNLKSVILGLGVVILVGYFIYNIFNIKDHD